MKSTLNRTHKYLSPMQSQGRDRLFDLGRIIATDVFLNNTNRFPTLYDSRKDMSHIMCEISYSLIQSDYKAISVEKYESIVAINNKTLCFKAMENERNPELVSYLNSVKQFLEIIFMDAKKLSDEHISFEDFNYPSLSKIKDYLFKHLKFSLTGLSALEVLIGIITGFYNIYSLGKTRLERVFNYFTYLIDKHMMHKWLSEFEKIDLKFLIEIQSLISYHVKQNLSTILWIGKISYSHFMIDNWDDSLECETINNLYLTMGKGIEEIHQDKNGLIARVLKNSIREEPYREHYLVSQAVNLLRSKLNHINIIKKTNISKRIIENLDYERQNMMKEDMLGHEMNKLRIKEEDEVQKLERSDLFPQFKPNTYKGPTPDVNVFDPLYDHPILVNDQKKADDNTQEPGKTNPSIFPFNILGKNQFPENKNFPENPEFRPRENQYTPQQDRLNPESPFVNGTPFQPYGPSNYPINSQKYPPNFIPSPLFNNPINPSQQNPFQQPYPQPNTQYDPLNPPQLNPNNDTYPFNSNPYPSNTNPQPYNNPYFQPKSKGNPLQFNPAPQISPENYTNALPNKTNPSNYGPYQNDKEPINKDSIESNQIDSERERLKNIDNNKNQRPSKTSKMPNNNPSDNNSPASKEKDPSSSLGRSPEKESEQSPQVSEGGEESEKKKRDRCVIF